MHKKILAVAAVLVCVTLHGLSAQERRELSINNAPTAAFDLGWLAKYYGSDWSTVLEKLQNRTMQAQEPPKELKRYSKDDYHMSLRANLLRWLTLSRDLGLEWRISPSAGIMVNASYNSLMPSSDSRIAMWEVAPEVRWYYGATRRWYLGAMFKAGQFNYRFPEKPGKHGGLMGGGITLGYQLYLSPAFSMDFGIGLGCLLVDCEEYEETDEAFVRKNSYSKNYLGPIHAGVTLVWKMF